MCCWSAFRLTKLAAERPIENSDPKGEAAASKSAKDFLESNPGI